MASSNFLQHNPNQSNQETDAQYQADSLRAGGIALDDILPSLWLNKIWYQTSTMCAALAQMMAAKGYSMSDANLATLAATLANLLTNADIKPGLIQVPFSPSAQFDCSKANGFGMTLAGNLTSLAIINAVAGQQVTLAFTQGNSGGYTVPFPSNVKNPGVVDAGGGNTSMQQFLVLGDGNLHPLTGMTVS